MFFQLSSCQKSQKGVKFNRNKSQKGADRIIMKHKIYQHRG